jgi:hypothetical protein
VSPVPVFSGHVTTAGKLVLDDREGMKAHVRGMGGKKVDVTIKVHRANRSSQASVQRFQLMRRALTEPSLIAARGWGRLAFFAGLPRTANPYDGTEHPDEWHVWDSAWEDGRLENS